MEARNLDEPQSLQNLEAFDRGVVEVFHRQSDPGMTRESPVDNTVEFLRNEKAKEFVLDDWI